MKVIELLTKIANGEEVPKKIRFNNIEWNRVYGEKNVYYINEYDSDFFIYLFRKNLDFTLNDEVEIIEEDKKIEKLNTWFSLEKDCENDNIQYANHNFKTHYNKINEIIDYIMEDK